MWKWGLLSIFALVASLSCIAQQVIRGSILDEKTGEPLSYATIILKSPLVTAYSNEDGSFEMKIPDSVDSIIKEGDFTVILDGYYTANLLIPIDNTQEIEILLSENITQLDVVEVRAKKTKYRNKDNPAVALIRNAIAKRDENKMNSSGYAQMQTYEKINFGSSNMPRIITRNPLFKPFRFVFDNVDTTRYKGSKTVILFLDETWSDFYLRKSPPATKKIVNQRKRVSLDPKFINEEGTVAMLKHLYQDIDIYENNFLLVTNNFKSPLSFDGPTFYKYFITDTTVINNKRLVHLTFAPRNKVDMLLEGQMTIAIDDNYVVKDMYMQITKHTNLNFVSALSVELKYEKSKEGKYYLSFMENDIQMMTPISFKNRIVGTRTVVNTDFEVKESLPDTLFNQPLVLEAEKYENLSDTTYAGMRPIAFNKFENKTYENLDSMKNMRYFKNLLDWSSALMSGYKNFGLIELGNIYRIYSYNETEGNRFRMGIRTNPIIAKRYFANGYLAYGTRDQTFKYLGSFTWSFKNQRIYDYPQHYFRMMAQYDAKVPGRVMETAVTDFVTDNIQRGANDKFLYARTLRLDYVKEFGHNLMLSLDASYINQEPRGTLYFVQNNGMEMDTLSSITSNNLGIQLRWAPGEKFFNDRTQRKRQHNKMPVFLLRGDFGFRGILDGDYQYQKLSFQTEKRFIGSLGILDLNLRANYIWGALPYPLLNIPRANQGYTFTNASYNLMNHGEFVTDKQVEFLVNYRMMGFVLNKVPLLKYLKLREVFGVKMLYGGLSDINNPMVNTRAMQFPTANDGSSYIYNFQQNVPYIEWNVGVENIFKILRIDYVRRVNYLNHLNVSPHRLQFSIVIDF